MRVRREEGISALSQHMGFAVQRERHFTRHDKENSLNARLSLRAIRTAALGNLSDVLRKRLCKSRQRARQNPKTGLVPKRQVAGHDIAHRAFGNDGIGVFEHSAIREQLCLRRQPARRGVVSRFCHDNPNLIDLPHST